MVSTIPSLTASQGALRISPPPLVPLSPTSSCSISHQVLFFPKVEPDYTPRLSYICPMLGCPSSWSTLWLSWGLLEEDTVSDSLLRAYSPPSPESQLLFSVVSFNSRPLLNNGKSRHLLSCHLPRSGNKDVCLIILMKVKECVFCNHPQGWRDGTAVKNHWLLFRRSRV